MEQETMGAGEAGETAHAHAHAHAHAGGGPGATPVRRRKRDMIKRALTFGLARNNSSADHGGGGGASSAAAAGEGEKTHMSPFQARRRMSDSGSEDLPARKGHTDSSAHIAESIHTGVPFKRAASTSALHLGVGRMAASRSREAAGAGNGSGRPGAAETSPGSSSFFLNAGPGAASKSKASLHPTSVPPSSASSSSVSGQSHGDRRLHNESHNNKAAINSSGGAAECKTCTHGEDFYATAGPTAVFAQTLPGDDDFELLVDPIPPSNRSSLVGLSQTWRNMRADRKEGEPGMQILYGSLAFLIKFVVGSRGYGYWDAFLTTYWQFSTPSEVLDLLQKFIAGNDPCKESFSGRSLYVMYPSDDGIMAVVSHHERDVAPSLSTEGSMTVASVASSNEDKDHLSSTTDAANADANANANAANADANANANADANANANAADANANANAAAAAPPPPTSSDGPSKKSPPSPPSPRKESESLRRIFKELGLDADTETLQRNAHAFLCSWMRQEGGNNVLTETEAQLATELMAAMDEWEGQHQHHEDDSALEDGQRRQSEQHLSMLPRPGLHESDDVGLMTSTSNLSRSTSGNSSGNLAGEAHDAGMTTADPPGVSGHLRKAASETARSGASALPRHVTLRSCHTAGSNGSNGPAGDEDQDQDHAMNAQGRLGSGVPVVAAAATTAAQGDEDAVPPPRASSAAIGFAGLRVNTDAQMHPRTEQYLRAQKISNGAGSGSPEESPRVRRSSPLLTPRSTGTPRSGPSSGTGTGTGTGALSALTPTISAPAHSSSSSSITSTLSSTVQRKAHKKSFTLDFGGTSSGGRSPSSFNKVGARARSLSHGWKKKRAADSVSSEEGGVSMSSPAAHRGHGGDAELEGITPSALAHYLTWQLYDDAYRLVEARDLVTKEARDKSIAVQRMIDLFDTYAWWALTYILNRHIVVVERVNRLLFFVDVATECRKLNNFHAFFGLVAGLSQPMLQWLWDFLSSKEKGHLENLKRAVRSKGDYLVYRADLSKAANKSHIPFLGLTTRLLYPLEHNIPFVSPERKRMINFSRCVSLQNTIDDFLRGQLPGFELDGVFMMATVDGVDAKVSRAVTAGSTDSSTDIVSDESSSVMLASGTSVFGSPLRRAWLPSEVESVGSREGSGPRLPVVVPKSRGGSFGGSSASILANSTCVRLNFDDSIINVVCRGMRRARSKERLEKISAHLKQRLHEDLVETLEHSGFM